MTDKVQWPRDPEVQRLALAIAKRAVKLHKETWPDAEPIDRTNIQMDIEACHANGCPLDLQRLLEGDDFNFSHDVWGIRRHLDRETGKLRDHFLPRYASKENGDGGQ